MTPNETTALLRLVKLGDRFIKTSGMEKSFSDAWKVMEADGMDHRDRMDALLSAVAAYLIAGFGPSVNGQALFDSSSKLKMKFDGIFDAILNVSVEATKK